MDEQERRRKLDGIWNMPAKPLRAGEWLWWFWLFFIHDKDTEKSGKCRQVMILWSVKPERRILCNGRQLGEPAPVAGGDGRWTLKGAAAAWYFDGHEVQEDFVLEKSGMRLEAAKRRLQAPGKTPSAFWEEGGDYVTSICTLEKEFEFRARQADFHPAVGPTHGLSKMGLGMEVEGTRLERLELDGWERDKDGRKKPIKGTAYFQKIRLGAPPPQWYWGIYHFKDGSFFTYMQVYAGRAMLADNAWPHKHLRKPALSLKEDVLLYHAPTGRVFEGNDLKVQPARVEEGAGRKGAGGPCWVHAFSGGGKDFEIEGEAQGYAHACWTFRKPVGGHLPVESTFRYNEYPALLKRLALKPRNGTPIVLENGWGNMENAWGFII